MEINIGMVLALCTQSSIGNDTSLSTYLPQTCKKNVQSNDALVPLSISATTEREWTIYSSYKLCV